MARAQIVCEMALDSTDNLKAKVTLSGFATNSGSHAFSNYAAAITNGTGVIFNAPDGVELIAGRTVGKIPAGALTFAYGGKRHNIKEIIFRATRDDVWFDTDMGISWANGATVYANGSFTARFAEGPNGETLDEVVPGTYSVNLSTSFGEGTIPFILKILANKTVTNTNDSGAGSLRQAIADAADGECIITFDPGLNGQTIRLTGGQLSIDKSLVIDASALPDGITISGDADNSGTPTAGDSRVFQVSLGHIVALDSLTITGGKAPDGSNVGESGGGIYNQGHLTVRNSTIFANSAGDANGSSISGGGNGGGIWNNKILFLTNSTVSHNNAGDANGANICVGGNGGGIWNNETLVVTNSTLNENKAGDSNGPNLSEAGNGGGIWNNDTLNVVNSTLSENDAGNASGGTTNVDGKGGAIFSADDRIGAVRNTIIAGNSPDDLRGDTTLFLSEGNNLIGDNSNVGGQFPAGSPNSNDDFVGTSGSPIEALLGPLVDNGGLTLTRMPMRESPAIDNGAFSEDTPATDQRGVARPIGGGVDIGAVEAPDYAALDAAAALRARLLSQIRKFKTKQKNAQRRKQVTKVKKFKKKVRKLKIQLRRI